MGCGVDETIVVVVGLRGSRGTKGKIRSRGGRGLDGGESEWIRQLSVVESEGWQGWRGRGWWDGRGRTGPRGAEDGYLGVERVEAVERPSEPIVEIQGRGGGGGGGRLTEGRGRVFWTRMVIIRHLDVGQVGGGESRGLLGYGKRWSDGWTGWDGEGEGVDWVVGARLASGALVSVVPVGVESDGVGRTAGSRVVGERRTVEVETELVKRALEGRRCCW